MNNGTAGLLRTASVMLTLFFLLSGARARAHDATGSIRGTVTDSTGAVAPDVQVTAIQPATGFTRHTKSDARGSYSLVLLPIGRYRLEAERHGFRKYVLRGWANPTL